MAASAHATALPAYFERGASPWHRGASHWHRPAGPEGTASDHDVVPTLSKGMPVTGTASLVTLRPVTTLPSGILVPVIGTAAVQAALEGPIQEALRRSRPDTSGD